MRLRRLLCLAPVVVLACADHTPTAPAHVREFNRPVTSPDAAAMTDSTGSNQGLTASFANLPATHNGGTAFTFEVHFSAEPSGLSYRTVRDSLFDVTNGEITGAGRVTQGSNLAFRVTLEPSRLSDISLTVRGTTDCEADHAVCTADGRKLAGGESATVDAADLITMRVADAEVVEAKGATLDFVVKLSRAASRDIYVEYRAYDGTAEAGADYEAVSSNFTLAAGDTTRTISVVVLADSQKEESETVRFWLVGVRGMSAAQITRPHAVGTIHDSSPSPDLEVGASVDDSSPEPGDSFTLSATVTNSGDGASASTTLRYYRSSDSTVTSSDTQVGTDAVGALAAAGTSAHSVDLTAPSSAGTYYYGACVDAVTGESDTANNCSAAVRVDVSVPLTAKFANLPETHDGETAFTFEVHFSVEPSGLSYETVRDALFDVTKGTINGAGRVTQGSNLAFRVRVKPSEASDISLTVRGTTDCEADHAVCTADGRMLAGGASATVDAAQADLEVSASVDDASPETGDSITLSATVTNSGGGASDSTTLRYYRSSDSTVTSSDTQVGTDAVGALAAGGTSAESVDLTAPSSAGTYYYGACVDAVTGESDTSNNCSAAVRVDVEEPPPPASPDLQVGVSVDDGSAETGGSFMFSATVTNSGDGASASTRLRYYRSSDSTVTSSDTPVGAAFVEALAAGGTFTLSFPLPAPASAGTYYYGVCVDAVTGESNTSNNCSASARVDVYVPLTAKFANLPETHDGQTAFTFEVHFSVEPSGLSYETVRDSLFDVTNASITNAGRVTQGSNLAFRVTVKPSAATDISLTVRGTTDCEADHAVCTADGRKLAGGTSDTVRAGYPDLEVDASVDDSGPKPGGSFTLSATVTNSGDGASASTTLRYYRSSDSTITSADTQVGTDAVGALAAGGTSAQSVALTAPSEEGTYYYGACVDTVTGESDTSNNCSASVRMDLGAFDIDLIFDSNVSGAIESAVRSAAATWESILSANELPDHGITIVGYSECAGVQIQFSSVDDLTILVGVGDLDDGVLANARVCFTRQSWFPLVGGILFDPDLAPASSLEAIALHEIGHVLGLGTPWARLLNDPSSSDPDADTHFTGALAVAAFDAAGGTGYTGGKVPVQNRGDDSHWRESVMDNEVMTPYLDYGDVPLSAITIQALADLGYSVNVDLADEYTLPSARLAADVAADVPTIDLHGDVVRGPIVVVDKDGNVVEVVPGGAGGQAPPP